MQSLKLYGPSKPIKESLHIGGSKSISNRVLIIRALSGVRSEIYNISNSDDTTTLDRLLHSDNMTLDAHHAGTTFRFMTAYLAIQNGIDKGIKNDTRILTGSARMKQRPIGPLVDALRMIGADITYVGKEGYPPLKIGPFKKQKKNTISINSGVSSQFISALCLIAPKLPKGLTIKLKGDLVSKPYLDMTLRIMSFFDIKSRFQGNTITIKSQGYKPKSYLVESDWSSASYHFAIASIAEDAEIELSHFKYDSFQGDSKIADIALQLGVAIRYEDDKLILRSNPIQASRIQHDFLKHPDLTQTIAVMAAAKNIPISYRGLKTLFIKETDRVAALQTELSKINVKVVKSLDPSYEYQQNGMIKVNSPTFDTYQDHRMAMAFAPLALLGSITINEPNVVNKSYPNFWKDMQKLGFRID